MTTSPAEDSMFILDNGISHRRYRRGDEQEISRHANNYKIWLNLSDRMPYPYTVEDAKHWIEITLDEGRWQSILPLDSKKADETDQAYAKRRQESRIPTEFAVCHNDKFIGSCSLDFNIALHPRSAEMGYWLSEEYWGQGIMSQVAAGLLHWGFNTFPWLVRIGGTAYSWNQASMKILQKIGMQPEGISRLIAFKDGKFGDLHSFAKIRDGFIPDMRE